MESFAGVVGDWRTDYHEIWWGLHRGAAYSGVINVDAWSAHSAIISSPLIMTNTHFSWSSKPPTTPCISLCPCSCISQLANFTFSFPVCHNKGLQDLYIFFLCFELCCTGVGRLLRFMLDNTTFIGSLLRGINFVKRAAQNYHRVHKSHVWSSCKVDLRSLVFGDKLTWNQVSWQKHKWNEQHSKDMIQCCYHKVTICNFFLSEVEIFCHLEYTYTNL